MSETKVEVVRTPERVEKMSKVILDFAQPVLAVAKSKEQYATAVSLAVVAWNLGCMAREGRLEELPYKILEEMGPDAVAALMAMVHRKRALYPDNNRMVLDYQLSDTDEQLILNVVTSLPIPDGFTGNPEASAELG